MLSYSAGNSITFVEMENKKGDRSGKLCSYSLIFLIFLNKARQIIEFKIKGQNLYSGHCVFQASHTLNSSFNIFE